MNINTVVNLPQEILLALRQNSEDVVLEMKRALALSHYKEQKLSLGQCAELAEMNKEDFIKLLSLHNISIFRFESDNEILEDFKNA